ncbi:MAG: hypothetical protein CSB23_00800 [Deltaproteobacteria bacterium]|nr:MAG: hypothetical protein CSB23_00800 [Deltaproteobacteria bacterium]
MYKSVLLLFLLLSGAAVGVQAIEINIGSGNTVHTGEIVGLDNVVMRGNGILKEEKRNIRTVNKIDVEGVFVVELVYGDPSLSVVCEANLLEQVGTSIEKDVLRIYPKSSFSTRQPVNIRISLPDIKSLAISGSSEFVMRFSEKRLEQLSVDLKDASTIEIFGEVGILYLHVQDSAEFHGYSFRSQTAQVDASGSADAEVFVSSQLSGTSTDASSVKYLGNPQSIAIQETEVGEFVVGE